MATLGPSQNNTTSTAFSGMQTTDFWTPVDLSVTQILWDLTQVGTYELRIDGDLINTRTSVNGIGVDMLSGASTPITITAGEHIIKITKTAGSNGWYYRSSLNSWVVEPWYHAGYWHEAGGGEVVPFRINATPAETILTDGPAASWSTATSSRTGQTYTVTWDNAVEVYGLIAGGNTLSTYEVEIEGVVVGTSPTMAGANTSLAAGPGVWVPFDSPYTFTGGVTYDVIFRRVGGASFSGQPYKTGSTSSNVYFDQTEWTEAAGNTPAIQYRFIEIADQTSEPSAVVTTTMIGTPVIQTDNTVSPATVATTITIGQPIIPVVVSTIVMVTTIDTPAISTGFTVTPAVVATTTAIGVPTVVSESSATTTPAAILTTTTIGTPTISLAVVATSVTIPTTATIGTPIVTAVQNATVSLATVLTRIIITTPQIVTPSDGDGGAAVAGSLSVVILTTDPVFIGTDPGASTEPVAIAQENPFTREEREVVLL